MKLKDISSVLSFSLNCLHIQYFLMVLAACCSRTPERGKRREKRREGKERGKGKGGDGEREGRKAQQSKEKQRKEIEKANFHSFKSASSQDLLWLQVWQQHFGNTLT